MCSLVFFWKKVNRKYLLSLCTMFAGVCFIWTLWFTIGLSVSFDLHVKTALSDLKTMYELNSIRTQPVKIIVVSCECFSSMVQPSSLASGTFQEKFKPTKREPLFIGFTAAFINIQFGLHNLATESVPMSNFSNKSIFSWICNRKYTNYRVWLMPPHTLSPFSFSLLVCVSVASAHSPLKLHNL